MVYDVMVYDEVQHLGDFFQSSREKGRPGLPLLSVTLNNGLVVRDTLERRTETNIDPEDHLLAREGYIVYNMMRVWQGALGRANTDGLVSPAYIVLKPTEKVDSLFVEYLFKTPRMIYLFWAYSYGLTKDRLRLYYNDFSRIPVFIPSLREQKKIAKILSTWDKAINITEQLIVNSQKQRKALMQLLLTGKKHFPGFSDEWKFLAFNEAFKVVNKKSTQIKTSEYRNSGKTPIVDQGQKLISGYCDSSDTYDDVPVIIFGDHTRCLKWIDFTFCPGADGTQVLTTTEHLDKKFGYYLLSHAHIPNLGYSRHMRELKEMEFKIPKSIKEQNIIASALSSFDKEIEKLQQKLDFLRQEKKALMQQLLSGKNRMDLQEVSI